MTPTTPRAALANAERLRAVGVAHIICHHDPRRGHGRETLARAVEVARALGATPWLEAVVASVDGFEAEIAALGQTAAALGSPFPVVLVSPASDLKCTLPGSPWPPCPPAAALYRARGAPFLAPAVGGGMFSYFTELNRKRPPLPELDFVSFTTSALVHAGDDRSVAETLESLPHIARSVRAIVGGKPYAVGPSAIGMRDNPYGQTTTPNPDNVRQAMNRNDPRQRGLLGAAWSLGYFAHFAAGGARQIALGGAVGPFGLLHAPADFPQPWFDEAGGLFPVYHVVRGLARLRGAPMRALSVSAPREVHGFAAGNELWLANLMGEPRRVKLHGADVGPEWRCSTPKASSPRRNTPTRWIVWSDRSRAMNSNSTRTPWLGCAPPDLKPQRNERGAYSDSQATAARSELRQDHPRPYRGRVRRGDRVRTAPNLTGKARRRRAPAELERRPRRRISGGSAHAQIRRQPLDDVHRARVPRPLRRGGGSGLRSGRVPVSLRSFARGDRRASRSAIG